MTDVAVDVEHHPQAMRITIRHQRKRYDGGLGYGAPLEEIRKFAVSAGWALAVPPSNIIPALVHALALTEKPA